MSQSLASVTELSKSETENQGRKYALLARIERDNKEANLTTANDGNQSEESLGQIFQTISTASQTIKALVQENSNLRDDTIRNIDAIEKLQILNKEAHLEIIALRDKQENLVREHEVLVGWLTADKESLEQRLEDTQRALSEAKKYLHEMTDCIHKHLGDALRQVKDDVVQQR